MTNTTTQKNTTHRTWERSGYTLLAIAKDGENHYVATSPKGAPELHVIDYYEVPSVAIDWASASDMNSDEAREYAAKITVAAEAVDFFQDIINVLS